MKNIIFLLIVLTSCEFQEFLPQQVYSVEYVINNYDSEYLGNYLISRDLNSISRVLDFYSSSFTYEKDNKQFCKYPKDFINERKGDCEDYSVAVALSLKEIGIENVSVVLINSNHAIIKINNTYIEPQTGELYKYNFTVDYELNI